MKQFSVYTKIEINIIFEDYLKSGKNNLLLTGGVGVGKTLYAKILANLIICQKSDLCNNPRYSTDINNGYIDLFSFGAHYNHENFIYGLRISCENGNLKFEERKKRFLDLCDKASEDSNHNYVAIFDDINRADISQTLGDMLSALESKDVGNEIHAGQDRVELPENLYIIATANPLVGKEKLDYAWMRRFVHYNILSDERHFGFDFDGSDAGDGYKRVDENWENQKIKYNDAGKINDVGFTFLRLYQWEIFMHIKIMYERYFFNPCDQNKRDQYVPGHGMFLTYAPESSYADNLVMFLKQIKHSILPFIKKMFSDGILNEGAKLDIWALSDLCGEKTKLCYNNDELKKHQNKKTNRKGKDLVSYVNELISDGISWSNLYFNICTNIWLRRIDRKQTPQPLSSSTKITSQTKCSFFMERSEYINEVRAQYSANSKRVFLCHLKDTAFKVEGIRLHWPYNVEDGWEYYTKKKNPEKLFFPHILERLKKYQCIEEERIRNMSNNPDLTKIDIMDKLKIKQMILQGPPGTSKTYGAKYDIIAPALLEGTKGTTADDNEKKKLLKEYQIDNYVEWPKNYGWDMVQFHPSYSYEDFVRGITVSTKDDKVVYETVNKILGKMCKLAADHSKGKFFLIIDEINRADVATVFGELIYALECRGEIVSIPYGIEDSEIDKTANNGDKAENKEGKNKTNYQLVIPDNLYIIGTMNTADKSIGTIDYAIRRRFLFFDCLPKKDVVEKYIQTYGETQETISNAINMMENLKKFIDGTINKGYHKKDFYIGHTYFLVKNKEELMLRLKYQIVPILREYYENGVLINDLNKMEEIKTRYPKLIEAIKGKDQSYDSQSDDSLFDALYEEIIIKWDSDELAK